MNKKNKIIRISIILIVIISSIMAFNTLPNEMAINFSLSGDINYSVNKLIGLLICPVILIITYICESLELGKSSSNLLSLSIYILILILNSSLIILNMLNSSN